jgi:hypothetical protein
MHSETTLDKQRKRTNKGLVFGDLYILKTFNWK